MGGRGAEGRLSDGFLDEPSGLSRLSSMRKRGVWQLQAAKNQFSEVVNEAQAHGPQVVTRHGRAAVVVMGIEDYRKLTGKPSATRSFVTALLAAPKVSGGLRIERRTDTGRKVELG